MAHTLAISVGKELGFAIGGKGAMASITAIDNTGGVAVIIDRIMGEGHGGTIIIEQADEGEPGNVVDCTAMIVARDAESYARRHGIPVVKFSKGDDCFKDDTLAIVRELGFKPQSANEANAICMVWAHGEMMSQAAS